MSAFLQILVNGSIWPKAGGRLCLFDVPVAERGPFTATWFVSEHDLPHCWGLAVTNGQACLRGMCCADLEPSGRQYFTALLPDCQAKPDRNSAKLLISLVTPTGLEPVFSP
jgi:hypothetical protein